MSQTEDAADAGFTLLEVIVAFVITSLSLTILFQTFSGGIRAMQASQMQLKAVFFAQSKLAEFEAISVPGQPMKGQSKGLVWSIEKTQHSEFTCATWLAVKVSWPAQAAPRYRKKLQMTTLTFQGLNC
ncbi:MAG: prepilin-type N-terminal cleavage/methylation domain-containing protein [Pseudomonadota bacterium]